MVLIRINKKLLKAILAIVLIISLGLNVYSYVQMKELTDKYESLVGITNEFKEISLVTFVTATKTSEDLNRVIEIFDISKGEISKKIRSNTSIQKVANSFLNSVSGMYVKVKAFPDKGYIIRIPLDPPAKVENHWLKDCKINSIDEVFIVFPEQGNPFLLVLDEKARPFFYTFEGNVDVLLEKF